MGDPTLPPEPGSGGIDGLECGLLDIDVPEAAEHDDSTDEHDGAPGVNDDEDDD